LRPKRPASLLESQTGDLQTTDRIYIAIDQAIACTQMQDCIDNVIYE